MPGGVITACLLWWLCSVQVADRIKKHMSDTRIIPREVEKNVKDFAQNVENLVDKVVSGEWKPQLEWAV